MKRKFTAFLISAILTCMVFCGCGSNTDTETTTAVPEETTSAATTPTLVATEMDYSGVYDMLLAKTYKFVSQFSDETIPEEGQFGPEPLHVTTPTLETVATEVLLDLKRISELA